MTRVSKADLLDALSTNQLVEKWNSCSFVESRRIAFIFELSTGEWLCVQSGFAGFITVSKRQAVYKSRFGRASGFCCEFCRYLNYLIFMDRANKSGIRACTQAGASQLRIGSCLARHASPFGVVEGEPAYLKACLVHSSKVLFPTGASCIIANFAFHHSLKARYHIPVKHFLYIANHSILDCGAAASFLSIQATTSHSNRRTHLQTLNTRLPSLHPFFCMFRCVFSLVAHFEIANQTRTSYTRSFPTSSCSQLCDDIPTSPMLPPCCFFGDREGVSILGSLGRDAIAWVLGELV